MITLEQAKVGMEDKVNQTVVDEFRKSSMLLDKLEFDNAVNPSGGSTLTYGYMREKTPSVADFRSINQEYTPQEASREKITTTLKIFGGSFEVDRVIEDTSGKISETERQMKQKVKAAASLFHYTVINGDEDVNEKSFDGLDKILKGTSTELNTEDYIDLSSSQAMDENYKIFLDWLDRLLGSLSGEASFLMTNGYMEAALNGVARRSNYLTQAEDSFGRRVNAYGTVPILNLGWYAKKGEDNTYSETPVVPTYTRTIKGTEVSGLTDIYVPIIDLDNFHGVTVTGNNIIKSYLPSFGTPGAVKKGEAEMVAAVALKNTRSAAVLRNIKIR